MDDEPLIQLYYNYCHHICLRLIIDFRVHYDLWSTELSNVLLPYISIAKEKTTPVILHLRETDAALVDEIKTASAPGNEEQVHCRGSKY